MPVSRFCCPEHRQDPSSVGRKDCWEAGPCLHHISSQFQKCSSLWNPRITAGQAAAHTEYCSLHHHKISETWTQHSSPQALALAPCQVQDWLQNSVSHILSSTWPSTSLPVMPHLSLLTKQVLAIWQQALSWKSCPRLTAKTGLGVSKGFCNSMTWPVFKFNSMSQSYFIGDIWHGYLVTNFMETPSQPCWIDQYIWVIFTVSWNGIESYPKEQCSADPLTLCYPSIQSSCYALCLSVLCIVANLALVILETTWSWKPGPLPRGRFRIWEREGWGPTMGQRLIAASGVQGYAPLGNFLILQSNRCIFLEDTALFHFLVQRWIATNCVDHVPQSTLWLPDF